MKPSKLTICGINSYVSPQTINFKKLSEGSLFGIFGATGSGKSTILDSIIIALYGTSDRDNLSNIINVNLKDAFIKFEFELERDETNLFEVTRTFKLRPSGLTSGAELVNKTKNIILGDSSEKVNLEIEKMLGINKKEFLKCIALPQNEFDKFLLDTPSERKKSISKLFNLEHFGEDLNQKVKERLNMLTVKETTIVEQLKGFEGLSEGSQKQLENEIKLNKKLVLTTEKQISALQDELKELDVKYNTTLKLFDAKNRLSDIKSRESYYLGLKFSIDEYNKNKENLQKVTSLRQSIIKLDEVNQKSESAKLEQKLNKEKLDLINKTETGLKDEKVLLEKKLEVFKVSIEKKKLLLEDFDNNKMQVKNLKEKHSKKLDELLIVSEHLKKVEGNLEEVLLNIENVQDEINKNEKLLKRINDVILLSESEGFIEKLVDLKFGINQTNLDEVEDYKIHRDILALMAKINKYISSYKTKLTKRDEIIKELNINIENLQSANKELIKTQTELSNKLGALNKKQNETYQLKVGYVSDVNSITKNIEELKDNIILLNEENKKIENTLSQFDGVEDCSEELNNVIENLEKLEEDKVELNNNIANNLSDIKAFDIEKKYLSEQIEKLKSEIPANFSSENFETEINEDNYVNYVNDFNNFEKQKNYFETLVENLSNELNNQPINTKMVESKRENLTKLQNLVNETKVKLGIDETNYKNNVERLIKQNKLETDLHGVHEDLKLTQKLASYISKNALVDFVSEEYLYLISEYANKFVYSISRGKYMLKYSAKNSGEFVAIDNFNGGIERGIKTLSGGERFIFSLGLALGVSQSIAVNNNKTFNFFFIDEGFGNLSEDYIDDVLSCFDSLIKLDFTVGFITHVDKMQEYITNKIIVTKENNEEGSIITEYC